MIGWQVGLIVAISIPLFVFIAALLWSQPRPEGKSASGIRHRIESEDESSAEQWSEEE
ncbi:hypothetical protein BJY24_002463 [Nocardia transvalensis]|uniref:Uncharacterized protein n=1 Tax=Nocardia transvalensis TaxID=37333 RepID=A0A7W9PCW7_9NOCA|nr:hypothetical protein [Nocardia transvalensis]